MEGLLELDRVGKLIAGKYRLELVLGRGGMGTVYRATHTWTGRAVAVKYLHPDHAQDAASVGRFLREARAAASVRHPNAVDVLDMGQDTDGSAYLVLELLEGTTLGEHIAANKNLDPGAVARLLVPVIEALEELHRVGVVHRDFKPANIFLAVNKRGQVVPKLLDFGVAKVLDEEAGTATTTGIVVGTPAYMAPEQAAGNGEIGPWTDLWAVGAVLYQCLVGELPFMAPTPSLMLVDVMTKTAPKLATRRPDLSPAVCAVVDRALTKDPKARYQSAAQMAEALCQAAGVEISAQTGPLPDLAGSVRSTSNAPPTLPSSDTIQLSSDSMMVAAVSPDAPTVSATPVRTRSVAPPPLPAIELGGSVREPSKDEKKHWTGPSATGRLHAPRLAGASRGLLAMAVVGTGLALWWLFGANAAQPSRATSAEPTKELLPSLAPPDSAPLRNEPSSSPPTSGAAAGAVPQAGEPTSALQHDASIALEAESKSPTETAATPRRVENEPARSSGMPGRSNGSRARTLKTVPKPVSERMAAPKPVAPASGATKPSEGASPPPVVREW